MDNLTSLFLSWGITLGISIVVSVLIISKKVAESKEIKTVVDNFEKEIAVYIADTEIDDLKQTKAGRELLELLNYEELTTHNRESILNSSTASPISLRNKAMVFRKSKGLGERHQRILDFLLEYQRENTYPPSIREIGEKTGITSTSLVNYYLDQLEKMGKIERDLKISRGVRISGINSSGEMLRIPILGPIAAGIPLPEENPSVSYLQENENRAVEIARTLLPHRETGEGLFAVEVKGDSMIDAMINDGDIVVMKPASDAKNGEMVAVWLPRDNEATLKYFFREKDRYRLQPANPTMKPMYIKKSEPLEVKGKVVMVIRKMERQLSETSIEEASHH